MGWETPRKSASTPLAHPACGLKEANGMSKDPACGLKEAKVEGRVLASCCAGDGAPRHKWVWSCGISWS